MASLAHRESTANSQKRILVAAPKGGCGKTTIAINLAVAATKEGIGVCAIDFDAQHSFDFWHLKRKRFPCLPQVHVVQGRIDMYKHCLDKASQHEMVFIDTPPNVSDHPDAFNALIDMADFILVPSGTGSFDLQAVGSWVERQLKPAKGRNVAFVLNRIKSRSTSYNVAQQWLNKKGRICNYPIRDLTSIEREMATGRSVMDLESGDKGQDDFNALWTWLSQEVEQ